MCRPALCHLLSEIDAPLPLGDCCGSIYRQLRKGSVDQRLGVHAVPLYDLATFPRADLHSRVPRDASIACIEPDVLAKIQMAALSFATAHTQ
jgi:hypothetical protein